MTTTFGQQAWSVALGAVGSAEAASLLREYYIEVSDRYYQLHCGRASTPAEIEQGLAGSPSDDLAPPTGVFLLGRYGDVPAACAGLRVLDPRTVELTRVFVRPALRGTGGGSRLLAAVDEAARDMGAGRIVLDTRLDLVEARGLYFKHGYAEIPAFSDRPYAEIWYGKQLGSR
jgi:GNAT superfamily N-acetyltransferase